jgi:hypothetical protein
MLGRPFFGGQLPIGPLFDVGDDGAVYRSDALRVAGLNQDDKYNEMADRFGISRIADRTANLAESIANPAETLKKINTEYARLTESLVDPYRAFFKECRMSGMPLEESAARADEYIRPQIQSLIQLIQYKYPYAVGGEGPLAVGNPLAKLAGNTDFKNAGRILGARGTQD